MENPNKHKLARHKRKLTEEPQVAVPVGSQMRTQRVGVVDPFTSRTHWPLVAAGVPGGTARERGEVWVKV